MVKNPPTMQEIGLIPESGRSPGEGIGYLLQYSWASSGSGGKESTCNVGHLGLIPGLGRTPGRRERLPVPVFLPGNSQGQRTLVGYSPWCHKESDTTERLSTEHS